MNSFLKFFVIMLAAFFICSAQAQITETIDNKKLVELTKAKLGDEIIIGLIQSSPTNFTCGINAILELKKDSVSERVIAELMKHCSQAKESKTEESNLNNPLYEHPSGIYVYTTGDTGKVLKKLYANVVTQEKSGGFGSALARAATHGLAKSAKKAALNGSSANVKSKSNPEFYFYFEVGGTDMKLSANTGSNVNINSNSINISGQNWWFSKATSPNEFTLIRLKKNSKNREFKVGKGNDFTDQKGIDEDVKIIFTFEEVKPRIFKVITTTPLQEGEYCFLYSSTVPEAQSNDKVFDFSIIK